MQRNEFLHEKGNEFHSPKCKPVKDAASKAMARTNGKLGQSEDTTRIWLAVRLYEET